MITTTVIPINDVLSVVQAFRNGEKVAGYAVTFDDDVWSWGWTNGRGQRIVHQAPTIEESESAIVRHVRKNPHL